MNTARYPTVTGTANGLTPAPVTTSTNPLVFTQAPGAAAPDWEQLPSGLSVPEPPQHPEPILAGRWDLGHPIPVLRDRYHQQQCLRGHGGE